MADSFPLQVLLASLAGWINRRQGEVLDYLIEENRVLKEQMKGRALRLTDDQRRRLAVKGKRMGRRLHAGCDHRDAGHEQRRGHLPRTFGRAAQVLQPGRLTPGAGTGWWGRCVHGTDIGRRVAAISPASPTCSTV